MDKHPMEKRSFVYVFKSVHNTTNVINYDATNNMLNSFLSLFDIWKSNGKFKMSDDGNHQEVWFECSKSFMTLCKNEDFVNALDRMGVKVVFDYPYEVF